MWCTLANLDQQELVVRATRRERHGPTERRVVGYERVETEHITIKVHGSF
jgi:hypothetical protein